MQANGSYCNTAGSMPHSFARFAQAEVCLPALMTLPISAPLHNRLQLAVAPLGSNPAAAPVVAPAGVTCTCEGGAADACGRFAGVVGNSSDPTAGAHGGAHAAARHAVDGMATAVVVVEVVAPWLKGHELPLMQPPAKW